MTMHSYEAEDKLLMKTMQPNNSLTLEPNMVNESVELKTPIKASTLKIKVMVFMQCNK